MKKGMKTVLVIMVVMVVAAAGMLAYLKINLDRLVAEKILEPDLGQIQDGTYIGEYSSPPVSARVQVEINEGKIEDVKILEHDHGQGEGAESIVDGIVAEQRIDVDSISGTTYSSRVILKAVQNALVGEE